MLTTFWELMQCWINSLPLKNTLKYTLQKKKKKKRIFALWTFLWFVRALLYFILFCLYTGYKWTRELPSLRFPCLNEGKRKNAECSLRPVKVMEMKGNGGRRIPNESGVQCILVEVLLCKKLQSWSSGLLVFFFLSLNVVWVLPAQVLDLWSLKLS